MTEEKIENDFQEKCTIGKEKNIEDATEDVSEENNLNKIIIDFINDYRNGYKQRSDDWYKLMGSTVGGSELGSILGINPYQKKRDLINNKVEILKYGHIRNNKADAPACWWGTMFESVLMAIIEKEWKTTIYGDDICIQKYEGHRNSPDGICVSKNGKKIVLLELKCPYRRIPKDGQMPEYYIPQVLSGLSVVDIAHHGIFIEAVFRICSIFALGVELKYNKRYHRERAKWCEEKYWGLIGVYAPIYVNRDEMPEYENIFNNNKLIDFGEEAQYELFNILLKMINRHYIKTYNSDIYAFDEPNNIEQNYLDAIKNIKNNIPDGHNLSGLIPWKVFKINEQKQKRVENFIEDMLPEINKIHLEVQKKLKKLEQMDNSIIHNSSSSSSPITDSSSSPIIDSSSSPITDSSSSPITDSSSPSSSSISSSLSSPSSTTSSSY